MSLSREHWGIFLGVLTTFFFATQDALTKVLTSKLPLIQFVMVRYWVFIVFALVFAYRNRGGRGGIKAAFKTQKPLLQIIRSLFMVAEIFVFAFGLRHLALSDMHALFILYPILTTLLARPFLGEPMRRQILIASGISFIGALFILRPGGGIFGLEALIPIACALLFAFYTLFTRLTSQYDHYTSNFLYSALGGLVLTTLLGLPLWQPLKEGELEYLILLSLSSLISHFLLIKALDLVSASILQPFNYLTLVWAVLIGSALFGERPDLTTILGAIIIIASGLWVLQPTSIPKGSSLK